MRFNTIMSAVLVAASLAEAATVGRPWGPEMMKIRGIGPELETRQTKTVNKAAPAKGSKSSTSAAATKATAAAAAAAANGGGAAAGSNCLNANAVQTGSASDGNQVPAAGQSASKTDKANFINFCSGQTITNGLQVQGGSCNGIVMGKIPSSSNMISSIITNPGNNANIAANTNFDITVQTRGLAAGSFTNAQATYYSAPQDLNGKGQIIGHTHVTVQSLGSLTTTTPPDPKTFAFFKGINDAGNGNGLLKATVTGGLPAGNYRVCTMTSASNHQPVLMPVAQRGAQDDCQKFTVGGAGGGAAAAANGGGAAAAKGGAAPAANGGGAAAAKGAAAGKASTAATTAAAAKATKAAKGGAKPTP
ncbi:hypothetical protein BP5796_11362 [Coleophoma crateriformis]|uniref:Ribosomal protein s17 n=1 Tax=Coleophoma crateriformis TaxID=565419 RepID=A0A3D8QIH6_9HELO|nr:hypothetical protein BP5796_11362 [Coleophoma crateriformis]